jgi:hypothetical protein
VKRNILVLTATAILAVTAGIALEHWRSMRSNAPFSCVAAPGEICPTEDFLSDWHAMKNLDAQYREMQKDPKIRALIALSDQYRGMSDRIQVQINQTIQQHPRYQWDDKKEMFVPLPPPPASPVAPAAAPPPPTPAPAKK